MSLFDFNKLSRPASGARPVNPKELFRSLPALSGSVNDLWQGQSKALELWHHERHRKDILVSLHTGAGKSLVGLLIAQSLVNEGASKVLYVCATNDLVNQTSREASDRLGFQHTIRTSGRFSNDLYSTGQGFCLTNYQALFNGRSVFTRDLRPDAILFDDTHVAEKLIRDCYTLKIDATVKPEVYKQITDLLSPHFAVFHREDFYRGVLNGESAYKVVLAPPSAVVSIAREHKLVDMLREHGLGKELTTQFALEHLADHLQTCTMFVSQSSIEIAPAFLPSKRISFLTDREIRRVYLSATLTSEVDFCRAFGKRPSLKIEPESDAGIGERLIILADRDELKEGSKQGVKDERVLQVLASEHKVLVSTFSYASSQRYKSTASAPTAERFTEALEQFRRSDRPGAFILVGRVDGIDLPHATCRVMLADSLPSGFSLHELFLFDFLEMRNSFAAKIANRITQLFGRTNRGRNDYSVIFVTDRRFKSWLSTPRNLALLPELLRKQIRLGQSLATQFKVSDISTFPQLATQVVSRDAGWLAYYKDSVSGTDVSEQQMSQAAENDAELTEAALAEAEFAAHVWDGNTEHARLALGKVVDSIVVADRRLAGWYNIQIGHTFEIEGDGESAAKQYSAAKSRTSFQLALPIPASTESLAKAHQPRNPLHLQLLEIFENDIRIQNDRIDKYERAVKPLFDKAATANQHEEAARALGELLGFEATRPEQESEDPSTLDVLWMAEKSNDCILIELKTKKEASSSYNAADVGQAMTHLEWARKQSEGKRILGLILLGGSGSCTREAAPSDQIWISDLAPFKQLFEDFRELLRALQRMPPLDRYGEISALCMRPEWQAQAVFERIRGSRLLDVPRR